MRIPQIQITKTDIQMNYNVTDPVQRISQPKAQQTYHQPAATVDINTTRAKMDVDMTQFYRDVNLKPIGEVIEDYANKGRQSVLQGISKRVGEGRQLMEGAGKGAGTIKSIAIQNHGPKRPPPINIDFTPSYQAIKVNITPGKTDINIQENEVEIDTKVNKPIHDYTPGNVTGTMVVRPNIQIDVIG